MENPARVALLKYFKWKRVAVIVQQADIFELVIKKGSLIFISLAAFRFSLTGIVSCVILSS